MSLNREAVKPQQLIDKMELQNNLLMNNWRSPWIWQLESVKSKGFNVS